MKADASRCGPDQDDRAGWHLLHLNVPDILSRMEAIP